MSGAVRVTAGALFGAAVAGVALRARRLSELHGMSLTDTLSGLPGTLREDFDRVRRAAEGSLRDGRRAARQAEGEVEQVLRARRRKRGDA
jgi:hypothetical protein